MPFMHRQFIAHPHIASFSVCLLLAFIAGHLLARRNAASLQIPGRHIDNQALLMVILSLVGARFFSWLFYFPAGTGFWKAMSMGGGGLVFYGGLVFALFTAVTYALIAKLPLRDLTDLWAGPVAIGLGIGRIGCFMAGCCWGDICIPSDRANTILDPLTRRQVYTVPLISRAGFPMAVRFPADTGAHEQHQQLGLIAGKASRSLPVHPAQLYEAAAVFALAILLQRKFAKRRNPGSVFGFLVLGYGIIRFLVEFLRADNPPIYFGLTLSQVISLCFITAAVVARLMPISITSRECARIPN